MPTTNEKVAEIINRVRDRGVNSLIPNMSGWTEVAIAAFSQEYDVVNFLIAQHSGSRNFAVWGLR